MTTKVFVKARHTVWLGDGPVPYPECELSIRKALPDFNHFNWTIKFYPKGFALLDDMIANGHLEIATEYLKILSLVRYKGIYLDYNVFVEKSLFPMIGLSGKCGFSVAQHDKSYQGVDYLSTEIMAVPVVLEWPPDNPRQHTYILDYKSNFEHFYNQGERSPVFFGSNLLSRIYLRQGSKRQVLTHDEAYGPPNPKTLTCRSDDIVKVKRNIIPYQSFYAGPEERDNPFVVGHVKPRVELKHAAEKI